MDFRLQIQPVKKSGEEELFPKISAYKKIGETVEENEMPPKKILDKKPHMKLSPEEKKTLVAWAKKEAENIIKKK